LATVITQWCTGRKGRIRDMEMMQFHPTSLYNPDEYPSFLKSRRRPGVKAEFRDKTHEFMYDYDERNLFVILCLDVLMLEMKKAGEPNVWLDITHKPKEMILITFRIFTKVPEYRNRYLKRFNSGWVPCFHYLCGGILVNEMASQALTTYLPA
jgi:L-aspartate oxidase